MGFHRVCLTVGRVAGAGLLAFYAICAGDSQETGNLAEQEVLEVEGAAIFPGESYARDVFTLAKGISYRQWGPEEVRLLTDSPPFKFYAFLDPVLNFPEVWLQKPGGSYLWLAFVDSRFVLERSFGMRETLDRRFPADTYRFRVNDYYDFRLNLGRPIYPAIPRITNWEDAQHMDATVDFTVRWTPFTNGSSNDFVHLQIAILPSRVRGYTDVLSTPGLLETGALNGRATAFTIPANTLLPGYHYAAKLTFFKRTGLNTNTPSAIGLSGYFKETQFRIAAAPGTSAGWFRFAESEYTVSENGGMANITVIREGGSVGPAEVDFVTIAGTAAANTDYEPASGTLAFGDGEASKTFTVTILDDFVLENTETVRLALRNPQGSPLGTPSNVVVHIVDNEVAAAGTLQFNAANFRVSETGSVATVMVTRTGGTNQEVSVQYETCALTAVSGLDYADVSGTLTFAPGQTRHSFLVPISDDTLAESNETVLLALRDPSAGASLGRTNATLTIISDDIGGIINFRTSEIGVREDAGYVTLTVDRSGGVASGVTVGYHTSDGTATEPWDYTRAYGTISFGAGEMSQSINIPIIADEIAQGVLNFLVVLYQPAMGAELGTATRATVRIADDEVGLNFNQPKFVCEEGARFATITVRRSGPTDTSVGVSYATSNGTATAGIDFRDAVGTLSFAPGVVTQSFSIRIINDAVEQFAHSLHVHLLEPTGGALLGVQSNAMVVIRDDEFHPSYRVINKEMVLKGSAAGRSGEFIMRFSDYGFGSPGEQAYGVYSLRVKGGEELAWGKYYPQIGGMITLTKYAGGWPFSYYTFWGFLELNFYSDNSGTYTMPGGSGTFTLD